jgi:hypothetical protein
MTSWIGRQVSIGIKTGDQYTGYCITAQGVDAIVVRSAATKDLGRCGDREVRRRPATTLSQILRYRSE